MRLCCGRHVQSGEMSAAPSRLSTRKEACRGRRGGSDCFLGSRARITAVSCQNYKRGLRICIGNQHREALRSDLLPNTGQMSVRIPLALNV